MRPRTNARFNNLLSSSKTPGGILQFVNRHGAEAARTAHNREVTRSRRVAGIFQFGSFKETARGTYVPLKPLSAVSAQWGLGTGVAQRKRAVKHRLLPP